MDDAVAIAGALGLEGGVPAGSPQPATTPSPSPLRQRLTQFASWSSAFTVDVAPPPLRVRLTQFAL
jgi:hypothetical protein